MSFNTADVEMRCEEQIYFTTLYFMLTAMTMTPSIKQLRRWPIPKSRLPFINQDVTPIQFRGAPGIASSIWGGHQGGRMYAWNPDTRETAEFILPNKTPGAYMLQAAPDGRLYLGGGNGDLLRFDPATETCETLVTGPMEGIAWGGCVTDRHVIWSVEFAQVCVYDWREEKLVRHFECIDSDRPAPLAAHNCLVAPDGKAILGFNMPQARLIVLDPDTMTPVSFTPEPLRGVAQCYGSVFLDDTTMFISTGHHGCECHLLRYPGFELIATFDPPHGVQNLGRRGCLMNGRLHVSAYPSGDLYALDLDSLKWECVCRGFGGEEGDCVSAVAAHDGRFVCGVTQSGSAVSYDPQTGNRDAFELPAVGHCEVRALCPVPEISKVYGAPFITGRFWSLDLESSRGVDHGRGMRGGGQIDFAIWDSGAQLIYTSSYHATNLSVLDPHAPIGWPDNPHHLASAHDYEQMRDTALVFDGKHLWMGTCAEYGKRGGALCRIDPATGCIDVRRHIVPDQTITSVVLGHGSVYCGTSIHADSNSTPATQTHGKLIRIDPISLTITAETTVGDAEHLFALGIFGDYLLAQTHHRFYLWNASTDTLTDIGQAPTVFVNRVLPDGDGRFWTSDIQTTGVLTVTENSSRYEPVLDEGGRHLCRATDGSLWVATADHIITFHHDREA